MSIFDRDTFEKVEAIKSQAEAEISKIARLPVRVHLEVIELDNVTDKVVDEMLQAIADALWMNMSDYKSKNRSRNKVDLRGVAVLLLKKYYPSLTWAEIGNRMERHHTTTINAYETASQLLETRDEVFCMKYSEAHRAVVKHLNDKNINEKDKN